MSSLFRCPKYSKLEVLCLQLGIAWIAWMSFPHDLSFASQAHPTGLAHFFDLSFFNRAGVAEAARWIMAGSFVIGALGILPALNFSIAALLHIAAHSFYNSQGAIHHSAQPVSLILLLHALFYAYCFFKQSEKENRGSRAIFLSLQVLAACYVTAGITKLIASKGLWFWKAPNIVVEVVKTQEQNFYSKLKNTTTAAEQGRLDFLLERPAITALIMGGGLILELFAFLLLRSRFSALAMGLALLAMHLGIAFLMDLHFTHYSQLLWLLAVNPLYWLFFRWK